MFRDGNTHILCIKHELQHSTFIKFSNTTRPITTRDTPPPQSLPHFLQYLLSILSHKITRKTAYLSCDRPCSTGTVRRARCGHLAISPQTPASRLLSSPPAQIAASRGSHPAAPDVSDADPTATDPSESRATLPTAPGRERDL